MTTPTRLEDAYGRIATKLRISVTDRCDLRCTYCMPAEGLEWLPKAEILSFEEIRTLTEVAVACGVRKVRLTGGEPLVRRGIVELVRMLSEVKGLDDLAMTTNGTRLGEFAEPLRAAGLDRLNVSLDTLDPTRFHEMTRRDGLERVLASLDVAARVFPGRLKINAVALRGVSETELPGFLELARRHDLIIRFIEFMPLDADGAWQREQVLSGAELLALAREHAELEAEPCSGPSSPAVEYRLAGGRGGIGFINSVTEPFCGSCDRIRLTADGKIRTCLFSIRETDLMPVIRAGDRDAIARLLTHAVAFKEAGHRINDPDFEPASRSMSQIGG